MYCRIILGLQLGLGFSIRVVVVVGIGIRPLQMVTQTPHYNLSIENHISSQFIVKPLFLGLKFVRETLTKVHRMKTSV